MATVEITGPDGRTAELQVPDGATASQIKAKVQSLKAEWTRIGSFAAPQMASAKKPETRPDGTLDLDAMMDNRFAGGQQPQSTEQPRFGDSLRPLFGDHNPIAEVVDIAAPALNPSSERGLGQRAADTVGFVASVPVRMATQGHYGFPGLEENEQRFAENNPELVRGLDIAGTAAAGVTGVRLGQGAMPQRVQAPRLPGSAQIRRAYANSGEAGAYGRIAQDLPQGLDEFANQVATGASRGNVATNRRTLDILGEEMVRANGDVTIARNAAIDRIAQEAGITPQAAAAQIRRLTAVHEDSPLMLGEYPAVVASDTAQRLRRPENIDLDELGRLQDSPTQAKLDYLANNGMAQSAQTTRNAIARRQEDLAPSMRGTLDDMGPQVPTGPRTNRPATIDDAAQWIDDATRQARDEYEVAYNTPAAIPQRLVQLPRFLEYLTNRAASSAPEVAAVIRNAVNQIAVRQPDGRIGVQSLRQLQQGRTTLRGQMAAMERSGRADLANQIRPLYRLVTRVMEEMSPQWAVANRRWADMNFADMARELGDAFATRAGPRFREQRAEYMQLAPEAQRIVQIHFLQQLLDKLDNAGDAHSISKNFANDHSRNMIRMLFGDEAVVRFARAVRDQKVAERSQSMMANSRTHLRGEAQRQMDTETGLRAAVDSASVNGARNAILQWAGQLLTERRNRPLSRILTTPMNDTAAVAQHLARMRAQQQRLQEIDRRRSLPTFGVGGRAAIIGSGNLDGGR